jgi:hypothetical protein
MYASPLNNQSSGLKRSIWTVDPANSYLREADRLSDFFVIDCVDMSVLDRLA